jgi:hypothetical protein
MQAFSMRDAMETMATLWAVGYRMISSSCAIFNYGQAGMRCGEG